MPDDSSIWNSFSLDLSLDMILNLIQRESLDLALASNQPRVAPPALATGTGAGRRSLRISTRAVLFEVEVLIIHPVVSGKKNRIGNKVEAGIVLEPAGGTGESDEDEFVHGGPPGTT
jgi:hypothetical protein